MMTQNNSNSINDINLIRINKMQEILKKKFNPKHLEIIDNSAMHKGHAGAKSGKGHFELFIKSDYFNELSLIQSHREIYQALDNLMQTDIHALQIHVIC